MDYLSALFRKHPFNTCQPSHVSPLMRLYKGTASRADRKILGILHLFERERKMSVVSLLAQWHPESSSPNDASSPVELLCALNSTVVFQSAILLSNRRTLENFEEETASEEDGDDRSYDCILLLMLLAHIISHAPPTKHVSWLGLFRSNVFSVALRCLSLKDWTLRKLAYLIIGNTWQTIQVTLSTPLIAIR